MELLCDLESERGPQLREDGLLAPPPPVVIVSKEIDA